MQESRTACLAFFLELAQAPLDLVDQLFQCPDRLGVSRKLEERAIPREPALQTFKLVIPSIRHVIGLRCFCAGVLR